MNIRFCKWANLESIYILYRTTLPMTNDQCLISYTIYSNLNPNPKLDSEAAPTCFIPKINMIPINKPEIEISASSGFLVTGSAMTVVGSSVTMVGSKSLTSTSVVVRLQDGAPSCSRVLLLVLIFST